MDDSQEHFANQKTSDIKQYILYDYIYLKFQKAGGGESIETEIISVIVWGWDEGWRN